MACIGDECQAVGDESSEGLYDHVKGNDNEGNEQYFLLLVPCA